MPELKFIDIAANLTDGMFKGFYNGKQHHAADIPAVLSRAWDAGVQRIIVTGGSLEESKAALALANTDVRLFCTVGVHPTRCKAQFPGCYSPSVQCWFHEFEARGNPEKHYEELLALAKEGCARGKVVAIGECGLDYDRLKFCSADIQKRYFAKQFDLAEATGLPMFLHMRSACNDFCQIVTKNESRFVAGIVHSFTGSVEEREQVLSFEKLQIGINGCSMKTLVNLEVVAGIPLERMLIETDAPYCGIKSSHAGIEHVTTTWPCKRKEKHDLQSTIKDRNEPCHIRQVLEVVAGSRGVQDLAGISRMMYENTCRLFFPQDLDTMAEAMLLSPK